MPITALPTPPSRLDPANFSTRADAFLGALPQFVTEANTLEQSLQKYATTSVSTTSTVIGTGAKTLTAETGKAWVVGTTLIIASSANPANYMAGQVTSYNSSTGLLQINVTQSGGSGTLASWVISISAPSMTVANLSGGSMGSIPYQSGVNTTSMLSPGSVGQVLVSQGSSSAPIWGDMSGKVVSTSIIRNKTTSSAVTVIFIPQSVTSTGWFEIEAQAGGGQGPNTQSTTSMANAGSAGGSGSYGKFRILFSEMPIGSSLQITIQGRSSTLGQTIDIQQKLSNNSIVTLWTLTGGSPGSALGGTGTASGAFGGGAGGTFTQVSGSSSQVIIASKGSDGMGAYWDAYNKVFPSRSTPSTICNRSIGYTMPYASLTTVSYTPQNSYDDFGCGGMGSISIGTGQVASGGVGGDAICIVTTYS